MFPDGIVAPAEGDMGNFGGRTNLVENSRCEISAVIPGRKADKGSEARRGSCHSLTREKSRALNDDMIEFPGLEGSCDLKWM